jgi:hypothetical protein
MKVETIIAEIAQERLQNALPAFHFMLTARILQCKMQVITLLPDFYPTALSELIRLK